MFKEAHKKTYDRLAGKPPLAKRAAKKDLNQQLNKMPMQIIIEYEKNEFLTDAEKVMAIHPKSPVSPRSQKK